MKVLLLAGGDSNERPVSLNSGAAICEALRRLDHEVIAIDPATGQSLLDSNGRFLTSSPQTPGSGQVPEKVKPRALASSLAAADFEDIDVVFIALHGGTGENGSIQNLLHLAGKKYTGSNMVASAAAMNKAMTKRLMRAVGVCTPKWKLYQPTGTDRKDAIAGQIERDFKLPIIVKPNDSGSTIGLTRVTDIDQIGDAVRMALEHSSQVLVEEYIPGRELTVSVFDGRAFPVVEIKPVCGLYDYEAKYTKGKSEYVVPAPLDDSLAQTLKEAAVKVYNAVGAAGLARVDFILAENNDYYCLELNTLPGMTGLSLSPMSLNSAGIDFDRLVSMIIDSAIRRQD
jgi:D-alanine-D-alanine ligase